MPVCKEFSSLKCGSRVKDKNKNKTTTFGEESGLREKAKTEPVLHARSWRLVLRLDDPNLLLSAEGTPGLSEIFAMKAEHLTEAGNKDGEEREEDQHSGLKAEIEGQSETVLAGRDGTGFERGHLILPSGGSVRVVFR